jgi:hypothetical protein
VRKSPIPNSSTEAIQCIFRAWETPPCCSGHAIVIGVAVVPENSIRRDSRDEGESAHHPERCSISFSCLGRLSPASSGRGAGLRSRTSFFARAPRRPHLRWVDRALFIWLYRRCPRVLRAITIVRPETVLRWHRMGFAAYWRWKSRSPRGRPRIAQEVRELIRRMSLENPVLAQNLPQD